MVWQLIAIWAIVLVTFIWFFREERRRAENVPAVTPAPYRAAPSALRSNLSSSQRQFLEELRQQGL